MPAGPNLTAEELQQLYDLLMAFEHSEEVEATATPQDYDALSTTTTLINYTRASRPEGEQQ